MLNKFRSEMECDSEKRYRCVCKAFAKQNHPPGVVGEPADAPPQCPPAVECARCKQFSNCG